MEIINEEERVSIIIPLYNQVAYTKLCFESLCRCGLSNAEVLFIDNCSSDGTAEYLSQCPGIQVHRNNENRGCAGAWNQGARAAQEDWILFLNNDVIVSPGWLDGLVGAAREKGLDVVSPAVREGELNYDIPSYAEAFVERMRGVGRQGVANGICFMVRRQVFETIGFFDENFRIGQFEDTDFFRRASIAGFRLGITGRSFIHHFGSVTQNSVRKKNPKPYARENRLYFRRKWKLSWWKRFLERRCRKIRDFIWRTREKRRYGHTLYEKWINGRLTFS